MNPRLQSEVPWVAVKEVCHLYGRTYESCKNLICAGTFDVPTYKVGKKWVIDKAVHDAYFLSKRETGLRQLQMLRG